MKRILTALCLLFTIYMTASTPEPIAYWSFDSIKKGVVPDLTGNGHDGKVTGKVKRVKGVSGKGVEFPGNQKVYIECHNLGDLNLTTQFTIEGWVYRTDTGTNWDGIICNGSYKAGYQMFYGLRGQALYMYMNTDKQGYGPVKGNYIPVKEWMHIVATFDSKAEKVKLYQNGILTAEETYKGKVKGFPKEFYLGRSKVSTAYRGKLDEVKIYDQVLTADLIDKNYQKYADQLPKPMEEPPVLFQKLKAEMEPGQVRLLFEKTNSYSKTNVGKSDIQYVRIYRTEDKRSNISPGAASGKLIFRGRLNTIDGTHYEYIDKKKLKKGRTYAYWVSQNGKHFRVKPAKIRKYHPEIWWTPEKIDATIDRIGQKYADQVEIREVGKTVEGRPLRAIFAGNPDRRIVLIGAVHVSESGPELILPAVEGILKDNPELLKEVGIAALPCMTLDQRNVLLSTGHTLYMRKNANGVDLNRNFNADWAYREKNPKIQTYQGTKPESEPEIHAIKNLLAQSNPLAIFSLHSIASLSNGLFLCPRQAYRDKNQPYLDLCKQITRTYAEGMYGKDVDKYYEMVSSYAPATLGEWVYQDLKIPSFDLELDSNPLVRKYAFSDTIPLWLHKQFRKGHQHGIEKLMKAFTDGTIKPLKSKSDNSEK